MILSPKELLALLCLAVLVGAASSYSLVSADWVPIASGRDPEGLVHDILLDRDGFVLANCRPPVESGE
jgi:hypothetical protein